MNLYLQNLPLAFDLVLWGLLIATWVVALWRAPWVALLARPGRQHALFAATLLLVLLWLLQMQWFVGLVLHPLALTSVTVIFGWSLAILAGSVAHLALLSLGYGAWSCLPLDVMIGVVVPVMVTYALIVWVVRLPSRNLFVFMLGIGFGGAIVGLLSAIVVLVGVLWALEERALLVALGGEAMILVLVAYAEGFLNGIVVTATTVFFPDLVKHFDDQKYLG